MLVYRAYLSVHKCLMFVLNLPDVPYLQRCQQAEANNNEKRASKEVRMHLQR